MLVFIDNYVICVDLVIIYTLANSIYIYAYVHAHILSYVVITGIPKRPPQWLNPSSVPVRCHSLYQPNIPVVLHIYRKKSQMGAEFFEWVLESKTRLDMGLTVFTLKKMGLTMHLGRLTLVQ